MTEEHMEQLKLLSEKLDYNTHLTEGLAQKVSAVGSDLAAFKLEMKPWLEAKIGINLLWRWGVSIPIIIASLIGIKTLLGWLGYHK